MRKVGRIHSSDDVGASEGLVTVVRIKHRLRSIFDKTFLKSFWGNYFKVANVNWLYKGLDGWTRMRLWAFKEKRKSYNSNRRITNAFLENLGLKSLSKLLNPKW
jgi:hypothetical protein